MVQTTGHRMCSVCVAAALTPGQAEAAIKAAEQQKLPPELYKEALWLLATLTEDPAVRDLAVAKLGDFAVVHRVSLCLRGVHSVFSGENKVAGALAKNLIGHFEIHEALFGMLAMDNQRPIAVDVFRYWLSGDTDANLTCMREVLSRMEMAPDHMVGVLVEVLRPFWRTPEVREKLSAIATAFGSGTGSETFKGAVVAQRALNYAQFVTQVAGSGEGGSNAAEVDAEVDKARDFIG